MVGTDKMAAGGSLVAPDQGSRKLQTVRGSQRVGFQPTNRDVAKLLGRQNFAPALTEELKTSERALLSRIGKVACTTEPTDSAGNFDWTSPPDDRSESTQKGLRLASG